MLDKKLFKYYVNSSRENSDLINQIPYWLNIDRLTDFGFEMFNELMSIYFNSDGLDYINWWVYERTKEGIGSTLYDKDGKEIPTKTIDDLWNLVKDCQK